MKKNLLPLITFLFTGFVILLSCKKDGDNTSSTQPIKKAPVANAGPDQVIALPTDSVSLDGTASSDPDGTISAWLWNKISGPASFTISNPTASATVVKNLTAGAYEFELKVTDSDGFIDNDTIAVTVITSLNTGWRRISSPPVCGQTFLLGIDADNVFFGESYSHKFYKYNYQLNSWTPKLDLPYLEAHFKLVNFCVNGKGYIGMGFYASLSGNDSSDNRIFQFDPTTDQWTQKNNAPVSGTATPLVINGFIYLVKGHSVWKYDPVTDTYAQKNNFPGYLPDVNTIYFSDSTTVSFVINGEGYLVSGSGCWKYNTSTDNWQQKAGLPGNTYAQAGFSLNNFGYILTDSSRSSLYNIRPLQLWQYDPLQDQWLRIYDDYPGSGTTLVKTAAMNGIVYVGFGYHTSDINGGLGCDFWKFQ